MFGERQRVDLFPSKLWQLFKCPRCHDQASKRHTSEETTHSEDTEAAQESSDVSLNDPSALQSSSGSLPASALLLPTGHLGQSRRGVCGDVRHPLLVRLTFKFPLVNKACYNFIDSRTK